MTEASTFAQKLADEHGIDLVTVTGTGNEGLIIKTDVENAIGRKAASAPKVHTNIMEAQIAAREDSHKQTSNVPEGDSDEIIMPSQADMLEIIGEMRKQIASLESGQASLIEHDTYDRDLTDDMFFIAKPNGNRWEERRIVDKRTVIVDMVGTAFFGPFKDEEMIETYLKEKRSKREDSWLNWQNVTTMMGKEARLLDRQEKADREATFVTQEAQSTNVLDRRMWSEHKWGDGSESGVGELIGPAA